MAPLFTTKNKHNDPTHPSHESTPVILVLEVIFCMIQFFLNSDDKTGDEFVAGISHNSISDLALISAGKVCSKQRCCLQWPSLRYSIAWIFMFLTHKVSMGG
jgi:hypothetical protein